METDIRMGKEAGIATGIVLTGVTDENWDIIVALKNFLDWTVSDVGYLGLDSRDVSWAFLPYLQLKGEDWLNDLPNKNIVGEAQDFGRWIRDDDGYKPSAKMVEEKTKGSYLAFTEPVIAELIYDVLEKYFNLGTSFKGIVTLKTTNSEDEEFYAGHEFAIKHIASEDYFNNQFIIYDQTSGISQQRIQSDDDIVDILTDYIRDTYITNPIAGSDTAEVIIMIDYA